MEPDPTHRGADGSMAHPSLLRQSVVQTDTQPPRTLLVLEQSLQMWDQQGKGLQFCGGISVTESGEAPRTAPVGTSVRGGGQVGLPYLRQDLRRQYTLASHCFPLLRSASRVG